MQFNYKKNYNNVCHAESIFSKNNIIVLLYILRFQKHSYYIVIVKETFIQE